MTIIEIIYLGFFGILAILVSFFVGYTRHAETRARLLRLILKRNYGVVEVDFKGGFVKRLVHDFNKNTFTISRGEHKKTFILDKNKIKHEGNIPLARFVEDDVSSAENLSFSMSRPVSTSAYKVPPENVTSEFVLQKNVAAAKANQENKWFFLLLVLIGIFSLITMILVFVNFSGVQALLQNAGLEGGISVGSLQ